MPDMRRLLLFSHYYAFRHCFRRFFFAMLPLLELRLRALLFLHTPCFIDYAICHYHFFFADYFADAAFIIFDTPLFSFSDTLITLSPLMPPLFFIIISCLLLHAFIFAAAAAAADVCQIASERSATMSCQHFSYFSMICRFERFIIMLRRCHFAPDYHFTIIYIFFAAYCNIRFFATLMITFSMIISRHLRFDYAASLFICFAISADTMALFHFSPADAIDATITPRHWCHFLSFLCRCCHYYLRLIFIAATSSFDITPFFDAAAVYHAVTPLIADDVMPLRQDIGLLNAIATAIYYWLHFIISLLRPLRCLIFIDIYADCHYATRQYTFININTPFSLLAILSFTLRHYYYFSHAIDAIIISLLSAINTPFHCFHLFSRHCHCLIFRLLLSFLWRILRMPLLSAIITLAININTFILLDAYAAISRHHAIANIVITEMPRICHIFWLYFIFLQASP